jgi:uncharacterized protein
MERHGQVADTPEAARPPAVSTDQLDGEPPRVDPIAPGERSLAPDIARGLLLLFIALANVALFHVALPGPPPPPGIGDRIVSAVEAVFVLNRSRPMFAVLFGFGMAMMAARMAARDVDGRGIRRVLRRRSLWLMLFGLMHAALLFPGDILAPYGATGLIALWLVNRSNRVLRGWFWATLVCSTVALGLIIGLFSDGFGADTQQAGETTYPQYVLEGLVASVLFQVMGALRFLPLVIVGFWLFRSGWLTRPQDHLSELRRVFVVTMIGNVVLSVPRLAVTSELWTPTGATQGILEAYDNVAGAGAGVGYVCGFALLAVRWADRGRQGLPGVLASVGERSMTSYLLQSVVFFAALTGWGFGLGAHLEAAGDAVVAVAAWSLIAVAMVGLARRGARGPAEALIRRLTYRAVPRSRPAHEVAGSPTVRKNSEDLP